MVVGEYYERVTEGGTRMPKYMIIHNASEPARDFMARFTPEEMQAGMAEWDAWRREAEKTVGFEYGMPLQAVARVAADGSEVPSDNPAAGYSIITAPTKEAVVAVLATHPHLKRPDATMDVLEVVGMPGLNTEA